LKYFSKKRIVEFIKFGGKFVLANILAIAATSFATCFYYNKSSTETTLNGRSFSHLAPYSHFCMATEGYCNGTFDSNGFNNLWCVERNVQILPPEQTNKQSLVHSLLLGSSEMYGVYFPMNKHCCYLINKQHEGDDQFLLYNIGESGNALVYIANEYEEALDYFQPKRYAILETRVLPKYANLKNFETAKMTLKNHLENKLFLLVSQYVYSIRLMTLNIQKGLSGKQKTSGANLDEEEEKWNDGNVDRLRDFLRQFSEPSRIRGVRPIIFYHPRPILNIDGSATLDVDPKDVELYRTECEKQGIVFVCLGDRFLREYEEKNILPYGFWNTLPNTGHLNREGHRMIADELCKVIDQLEGEKKENVQ